MVNNINQAFSEIYDIINHFEKELYVKMPKGFINMIKDNRDKNYQVSIDYTKDINEQDLLQETRAILSLVYRDYLCSQEERKYLLEKDKEDLVKYEEEIREKYDIDNIFKKRNQPIISQETTTQETAIVKYKESIFNKIINKIKIFFMNISKRNNNL